MRPPSAVADSLACDIAPLRRRQHIQKLSVRPAPKNVRKSYRLARLTVTYSVVTSIAPSVAPSIASIARTTFIVCSIAASITLSVAASIAKVNLTGYIVC